MGPTTFCHFLPDPNPNLGLDWSIDWSSFSGLYIDCCLPGPLSLSYSNLNTRKICYCYSVYFVPEYCSYTLQFAIILSAFRLLRDLQYIRIHRYPIYIYIYYQVPHLKVGKLKCSTPNDRWCFYLFAFFPRPLKPLLRIRSFWVTGYGKIPDPDPLFTKRPRVIWIFSL